MIERLKLKWQLDNVWQVLAVLATFSLTGLSVVGFRSWLFQFIGLGQGAAWYYKAIAWLLVVFPAYQILLLLYGTLLGQFRFFWQKKERCCLL